MPTWFDLALRQPDESWRALRQRRATAPAVATSPERAATFRSALEQAEQQMRAAAAVGYDSRALNLFYGLSQGGRALAAASPALSEEEFRLSGHGLRSSYPSQGLDVTAVQVRPAGREQTSFQRLSTVLGSPLPDVVTLGELWPLMYETTLAAPLGELLRPPLEMTLRTYQPMNEYHFVTDGAQIPIPAAMAAVPIDQRPGILDFVATYPALRGSVFSGLFSARPGGEEPVWPPEGGTFFIEWEEIRNTQTDPQPPLLHQLTLYRGKRLAMPAAPGRETALHPLMAWWQVLYALSMLTRYEPARWTRMIDVDASDQTVSIEYVLDLAVAAVPDLLDEAFDRLETAPDPAAT